jgi:hypothetical protein
MVWRDADAAGSQYGSSLARVFPVAMTPLTRFMGAHPFEHGGVMAGNDDAAAHRPLPRRRRQLMNLRADMTASDLIAVLEQLWFIRDQSIIRLDRGVRDFLVRALQQQ